MKHSEVPQYGECSRCNKPKFIDPSDLCHVCFQATQKPTMARKQYGTCETCGGPASRKHVKACRKCSKGGGAPPSPRTALLQLTVEQRVLYDQIMFGRSECIIHGILSSHCERCANSAEAIMEVERATQEGTLVESAEWWIAGTSEPVHLRSSLALIQDMAMV